MRYEVLIFSKKNWAIVFGGCWALFSIVNSVLSLFFRRVFASSTITFLTGGRHSSEECIQKQDVTKDWGGAWTIEM